jgi:hypothetical protein
MSQQLIAYLRKLELQQFRNGGKKWGESPMPYATLEQMQDMELGVTGETVIIRGVHFERMVGDDGLFGWAALHIDANGDAVDWDRVSEEEAHELGLLA